MDGGFEGGDFGFKTFLITFEVFDFGFGVLEFFFQVVDSVGVVFYFFLELIGKVIDKLGEVRETVEQVAFAGYHVWSVTVELGDC